ncbi:Hypothetical Protein XCAW_00003 [Xanthomonas citri subsp. citri Aw12879]|nr:Hypothetical Protein XCAW_00003 [Xanthomonas citri subsp. citri Aw12879]
MYFSPLAFAASGIEQDLGSKTGPMNPIGSGQVETAGPN